MFSESSLANVAERFQSVLQPPVQDARFARRLMQVQHIYYNADPEHARSFSKTERSLFLS